MKASWKLLFTESANKHHKSCRKKNCLIYFSWACCCCCAWACAWGEEGNSRSQTRRGCCYLPWSVLRKIQELARAVSWIPLQGEYGHLDPHPMYTFLPHLPGLVTSLSTDNTPHLSNGLTVERKNWRVPFLPCLPNWKVSGCCYNVQTRTFWHKCCSKADRQPALYQPPP